MKHRNALRMACGFALAWLALVPAGAQQKAAEKSRFAADKGKLRLVIDGQTVGTEEFQISSAGTEWSSRAEVRFQLPGAAAGSKLSATLRFGSQGNALSYDWSLDGERKVAGSVRFDGSTANVELRQDGSAPFTQQHMFSDPRVFILDNNFYHHFGILGRVYDWEKKGPQTFSVYVPQEVVPGDATLEAAGQQEVDGARYETLRLRTSDLEMFLFFDKQQRLMRIAVPGSKVLVVRD